jgi:hypothetical protein
MWLPRFIDKTRWRARGDLPTDYEIAFCSPHGVDGVFLQHFFLDKDELLAVIARHSSDDRAIGAWFVNRAESAPERIAAWNRLAPEIGKANQPGQRGLRFMLRRLYPNGHDARIVSAFTAIAFDEGFIDELTTP